MIERKRGFSPQARVAAAAARRAKTALKALTQNQLEVFVTRSDIRFGWEIRKFGGVTIETAAEAFDDPKTARRAGHDALETRRV